MRVLFFSFLVFSFLSGQEIGKPFVQMGHSKSLLFRGVYAVISSDNKFIVSGGSDRTIKLWDIENEKLIKTFIGHTSNITSVAISLNSKFIVSSSMDNTIKIWDIKGGKLIKTFQGKEGFSGGFHSLVITADSKYIVAGCHNGTIEIWNINTERLVKTLRGHSAKVTSVTISSDNKYIVSGGWDETIKLWDRKSGELIKSFIGHKYYIETVSISSDNKFIASGSWDNTLKLWNVKSGKLIKTFIGHNNTINSVVISSNNKFIVSGSGDSTTKLWDIKNGTNIKTFKGNGRGVSKVLISPNSQYIALKFNKIMKLWDTKNGEFIESINNYQHIYSVLSSNTKYKVSVSENNKNIELFDLKSEQLIKTFKGHSSLISALAISDDDKYIYSGSWNGVIKIWDINNGTVIKTFKESLSEGIDSIEISFDNKYMVIGCGNNKIKILNIKNEKTINTLNGHSSSINTISISTNNKFIVSGSVDGTIKLWDTKSGKELLTLVSFEDNEWVAITPEGYFNASKNGAKHLNVLTAPLKVTSVDAYYEKFYRPDIVKLALQGKTVDTGLKMSDIKPAPEVEIASLPSKTDKKQIEVTLKLKDMGGGIGDIRIYRNGTAISLESRTIQRSQQGVVTKKYTIPLEKGKNKIEAIAFESTNSAKSEPPATATVMANYTNHSKPSLHAVIIGIEEFRNQKLNLRYTKADATALKETLERYSKSLFDSVNVTLLTSREETTKENISKVLTNLQSLNPNDMFLLFVASHGVVDDGSYYLMTSNVGSTRTKKLKQDALSQEDITKLISNIPTGKKLIILDTCSAGALGDSIQLALLTRGMSEDTAIKILSRATGTTILSASLSTQQAIEGYKGHGLFSYVLLEGLKKEADLNGDGFVKTPELVDYVDERVPEISKRVFGVEQFPTVNLDGQSFPVSRVE